MNLKYRIFIAIYTLPIFIHGRETQKKNKFGWRLSSIFDIINLAQEEENLFNMAKQTLTNFKQEIDSLERYTNDYEESSLKINDAFNIASSGIIGFLMIHRFTQLKEIIHNSSKEIETLFSTLNYTWPSEIAFNNTKRAFLHLHRVFRLPVNKLPDFMSGGQEIINLRASHSSQVGLYAIYEEDFDIAIQWMEWSRMKVLEENDKTLSIFDADNLLDQAIIAHNQAYDSSSSLRIQFFDAKVSKNETLKRIKRQDLYIQELAGESNVDGVWANYWALCSGQILQTEEERKQFFCYHEPKGFWIIAPLRVEQLSTEVTQIYGFLGNKEINSLIRSPRTINKVIRSKVEGVIIDWVVRKDVPGLENKILSLLDSKSKDNVDNSKPLLRVIDYTVGRCNDTSPQPHRDNNPNIQEAAAVTILFYLNDIAAGGETVFSTQRVIASPIKGSIVIWNNLWRNGTSKEMWHTSCPVRYGYKIVANRWIQYLDQFFDRPCSLNQDE